MCPPATEEGLFEDSVGYCHSGMLERSERAIYHADIHALVAQPACALVHDILTIDIVVVLLQSGVLHKP